MSSTDIRQAAYIYAVHCSSFLTTPQLPNVVTSNNADSSPSGRVQTVKFLSEGSPSSQLRVLLPSAVRTAVVYEGGLASDTAAAALTVPVLPEVRPSASSPDSPVIGDASPAPRMLQARHVQPPMAPRVEEYCGQGRRRWHCGVAQPFLTYLESQVGSGADNSFCGCHLWQSERPQSSPAYGARAASCGARILLRHVSDKIRAFLSNQVYQGTIAFAVVFSSLFGGIYVANGPTSCIGFNHLIYGFLVFCCFCLEMGCGRLYARDVKRRHQSSNRNDARASINDDGNGVLWHARTRKFMLLHCPRIMLTVLELVSCTHLLLILLGQPTGLYNSCYCSSVNNGFGAYVLLETYHFFPRHGYPVGYPAEYVAKAGLGCLPLLLVLYAMYAWCTQSFMSSYDYAEAMRGLARVRIARYILHGKWLGSLARSARALSWRIVQARRRNASAAAGAGR